MIFQIEKDGRFIGSGAVTETELSARKELPEAGKLQGYYFPVVHLSAPVVWEMMGGRALSFFFDSATLIDETKRVIGPVRYIHGRSKVMKGTPRISTVLLVDVHGPQLPFDRWIGLVPSIWEEFLRICNPSVEAS